VFELQVLMAAMTITGMMLGVAVDERERASAELRGSLRLAAAGQMAAALAHELVQPLTALNSYAEASRMLLTTPDMPDDERFAQLAVIARRMSADALRASEVVKRLRDFFRTGSAQLRRGSVATLLHEAVETARRRADALGIAIKCEAEQLPDVLLDAVQIAVVLRNLIANALDAASGGAEPRVLARASVRDRAVLVEVVDSGPGIDPARLHTLYEAGPSDKPGGMGVGLSICRAIVEAHGGALWNEARPHGHFCFTLPLSLPSSEENHDGP
jgi:C4-dicarboxylate-specific signal transduction histidine kinase